MKQESEVSQFFTQRNDGIIVLASSRLQDFVSSFCSDQEEITLDFILMSELLGQSTESLSIPIELRA